MLEDLKLDTVDLQPNYDDTRTEPTVLPGKFPNLLVNGQQGIAVGMATSPAAAQPAAKSATPWCAMIDHPEPSS